MALPVEERDLVRHCTLSAQDLDQLRDKRAAHNQLGHALLLCAMRHPGRAKKLFALLCVEAEERPDIMHVLLIDEISRCDVARVFGEALTYIESDKRGHEFTLASGSELSVTSNLVILATMNPWDKGVDELDVALERRFAQIDMPPDPEALRTILKDRKADAAFIDRIVEFFEGVQKQREELVHIGHAYVGNCVDEASAKRAWEYRLLPFFRKACRLDSDTLAAIKKLWEKVLPPPATAAPTEPAAPPTTPPAGSTP